MASTVASVHNVTAVVPLLMVTDMERSLAKSTREKMTAAGVLGKGVGLNFQCADALQIYREAGARGIHALREPQVGNFAWEVCFADPDRYRINFSSPTDLPEETLLSETTC